jgi:short-subunit dehydrogenase
MVEVNVAALTRLTALLLPGMLQRRRDKTLVVPGLRNRALA